MSPLKGFAQLADALASDWRRLARPEQLPPDGNWTVHLILAGRGWGKTRTGAEWVHHKVRSGCRRIAILGATASDSRDILIEGESGILACAPSHDRPDYEPSKRRLTWPNGAIATAYSADEPDRLRGPQCDAAWVDELAAFGRPEAWDQLMLGLRLGRHPQAVVTTTPRPTRIIQGLLAREGKDVVVTRGTTYDNAANLAPAFLSTIISKYEGTRLGRQELNAEVLLDTPGALWQRAWLDADRVERAPDLRRIVVAIDPAVSNTEGSDESGIIVAGVGPDGHLYVVDDLSAKLAPADWARTAISAFRRHRGDRIVAEVNNGGDLIEGTLRNVDPNIPFKAVHASRGKAVRAEPVSALYEQRKVHHVGSFATLEDQMCAFTSDFDRSRAGYSPDRVDALVWACTELGAVAGPMEITPEMLAMARQRPTRGVQGRGNDGSWSVGDASGSAFGRRF